MNILIATGIFPPDIGGPAKYAENLYKEFSKRGHKAVVLSFRNVRSLPSGLRHLTYFLKIVWHIRRTDFVLALDTFSVGFPALCAAKLLRKKIMVRIGGDFLWESYVERTNEKIYLREFYHRMPRLTLRERVVLCAMKAMARYADALVFNTAWQGSLFADAYGAQKRKVFTVENFYSPKAAGLKRKYARDRKKIFLWAGRPVKFKNIDMLMSAFEKAAQEDKSITLDVTVNASSYEFQEKLKSCWALILPSLTEIGSNTLCEGLAFNTPFILSRETGLSDRLKGVGLLVDPRDEHDIKNKILFLADEKNHEEYSQRVARFSFEHSWAEIADEFLSIYRNL